MSGAEPRVSIDVRDSYAAWPEPHRPPSTTNVVYIVLDDVGFAQVGCYGSNIRTPAMDSLAATGIQQCNFHATALCAPTRASLLTGRNAHASHMGSIPELASPFPGYDSRIPSEHGTLAEILREHGYATMALGKWHLTPAAEMSMGASRERWPLGKGFDRYYGFLGAKTNQFSPELVADNHQVQPTFGPDYHLSEDLADKAVEFVTDLRNADPEKPFFLYLAFGACHAPHHAPREYIDRYAGQFDEGWDAWRERTFARQLELGVLPSGTDLSPRPDWVPAWVTLSDLEKRVYARMMEVYAGFLEHTDAQIGRLLGGLERLGLTEDTMVVLISDNGASSEGGATGTSVYPRYLNDEKESVEQLAAGLDDLGGPRSYGHYPYGWAWAGNTPLKRWKQESHEGGVVVPCLIRPPASAGIQGQTRRQYMHVVDVTPTVLDVLGIAPPETVRGVRQEPMHGVSFKSCLIKAEEPSPRTLQYHEVRGCRSLYRDGWKAVAYHPRTGVRWARTDPEAPFQDDVWELYHLDEDFSECHDLAEKEPDLLRDLVALWFVEAGKYSVLPLDNRGNERHRDSKTTSGQRTRVLRVFPATTGIPDYTINLKARSHSFEATVSSLQERHEGVLVAQGSAFGGYVLYVAGGRLVYHYNYLGLSSQRIISEDALPFGRDTLRLGVEVSFTGPGRAVAALTVDGRQQGLLELDRTITNTFGYGRDYLSVGQDLTGPVDAAYTGNFPFSGRLEHVDVTILGRAVVTAAEEQALHADQ